MAPPGSDEDLDGEVSDFCKAACHGKKWGIQHWKETTSSNFETDEEDPIYLTETTYWKVSKLITTVVNEKIIIKKKRNHQNM